MTRKEECMCSEQMGLLFPNIFDPLLVGSAEVEASDAKGRL